MQMLDELNTLDDAALHCALKHATGKSNALTAQLLAQLGELEARGLHRERACSSLYTYCVYELRMSEDEAQRRCRAARLARQFPSLLRMLADAAIHLTGILLLGPHLTAENHGELLARAAHRTKREIERLVATIAPRADVPTLVVPLRRAGAEDTIEAVGSSSTRPRNTWAAFVQALAGPVRQLKAGIGAGHAPPSSVEGCDSALHEQQPSATTETAARTPPARESSPATGMRYQVQFTADQAYIDLLEEARDLLQHDQPDRNLVEVQRRALQLLVEQLRRRKHAATERPRVAASATERPRVATAAATGRVRPPAAAHGRHLPSALRRTVWQRDDGRCAYADERGVRCRETAGLEYHHLEPYACGGPNTVENVALRCRSHNALAAEQDFGQQPMARFRQRQLDGRQRDGRQLDGGQLDRGQPDGRHRAGAAPPGPLMPERA